MGGRGTIALVSVPLPAHFGKYQLLHHLAEGGMADVYLGRLPGPGGFEKRLVIKVIRPELAARREFCELFVAEAKITVSLTHANIVPVYELGMVEGQYFLAMELVDGPTVHQLVFGERRGGPLPAPIAAYITEQVLRGLDYAHRKGVIHRDLSSANVMCSREGEVKIVDFGIAAHYSAASAAARPRMSGGSAGYMAPEQQQGGGEPDARSDLYAVGVLLYEMVTGRRFHGGLHNGAGPPDVPEPLLRLIATATRERTEERYADAAAMLVEVSRYLREVELPTQADLARLVRRRAPDERRKTPHLLPRIIDLLPPPSPLPQGGGARIPRHRPDEPGPRTRPVTKPPADAEPAEGRAERADLTPRLPAPARDPRDATPPAPLSPPEPPEPPAPDAAGTVTFASRPARVHATWRTYAGAALLLLVTAGGGHLLYRRAALPPERPLSELRPTPQGPGALHIELPPGATLTIDGEKRAPGAAHQVPAGRHRIEAKAPGRRPVLLDVDVHPGATVRERLDLPWSVGHLRLESLPPGAAVPLNGEAAGVTPLDLDVPLDRTATLRLSSKGYANLTRDILPSQWVAASPEARLGAAGEADSRQPEMRLQLTLEPLGRGLLTVGATPWAQIFVDGERRGDTPLRRLPLSAGSHALRLYCPPPSCPEAREFRQNITIEPGREVRRVVDFRLAPPDVKD
jgi:serine/threonine protein kinase